MRKFHVRYYCASGEVEVLTKLHESEVPTSRHGRPNERYETREDGTKWRVIRFPSVEETPGQYQDIAKDMRLRYKQRNTQ